MKKIVNVMNRTDARKIAETITTEQLYQMILTAKNRIADWGKVSIINKTLSVGTAWNVLCKTFDKDISNHSNLYKINLIREFGQYLPEELKPKKKAKIPTTIFVHQEPNFENFKEE